MVDVYHRPTLAREMARQLLHPGVLDLPLRSGLFLSGLRRTGKSTFLLQDLIPALEEGGPGPGVSEGAEGAIVIYVDLWSNVQVSPAELILRAVRAKLQELENPLSSIWSILKRSVSAEVAAHGIKLTLDLSKLGEAGGATLADAFTQVVDQAETNLVLIVDEVQECLGREEGQALMQALKAARDTINLRPDTPGHFLFIGTGSHRSLVQELTVRRREAFSGALSVDYPLLDKDFVSWVLNAIQAQGATVRPSQAAAWQGFQDLGNRPESFIDALRILQHTVQSGEDADAALRAIIWTKRESLADRELATLEELGPLARAIFGHVARHEGEEARGLYSGEALERYAAAISREVRTEDVQPTVMEMQAKNLIRRQGHGTYSVTDPFVRQMWLERELRKD